MTMLKLVLLALLALPIAQAQAQEELPLADLPLAPVPPPPKKAPKAKSKAKKPAPNANSAPGDSGGALVASPPTSALPDVPMLNLAARIGVVFVRTPLVDNATAADLEAALRGAASLTPLAQNPSVLRPPAAGIAACRANDDDCFITRAAREGLDMVVVETADKSAAGVSLRVRQLVVLGRKMNGEALGDAPLDRSSLLAESEALYCKLMVPAGCPVEVLIDVGLADIVYQGHTLPRGTSIPMHATLPAGLVPLAAKLGSKTGPSRTFRILREKSAGLLATVLVSRDGTPTLATPNELEASPAPVPEVAIASSGPSTKPRWVKPTGYAVAGAGAVLLAAGGIEGLHSKSLINDAHNSYNAHGGAYAQSDLPRLASGNSAAHTANILLIAGGIAAAAGLTLAFVF